MKGVHVALFCSIPLFTILAPTMRETARALLAPSYFVPAYEGDGILVGDSGVSLPWWLGWASTINWRITQRPVFGDAFHDISLFVVPKNVAPSLLYRFDANYTSDYFYVDGEYAVVYEDMQHLDLRSSIYLLPKEYTPGREAKASFIVKVKRQSGEFERNKTYILYGSTTCQFQNRALYRDFVDMEPGAEEYAEACHSVLGGPSHFKDEIYLKNHSLSTDCFRSTQLQGAYNSFSAIVPTASLVKFETNITMYFYDLKKLINFAQYKCTIRNTDTCSFTTKQTWLNPERQLIIAYIHPRAGPFALTSTLSVTTDILLVQNAAHLLLYLLIPSILIRTVLV